MGKILFVDDDQNLRQVVEFILRDAGHEIYAACCGNEATRIYDQIGPDLVLTDLRMSSGDGFQVLRHVQSGRTHPPVPVVLLTAFGTKEQQIRANQMGAFAVLTKPCRKDLLCQTVTLALSGRINDRRSKS